MMNSTNSKKMLISPRVLTALLGIPVVLAIVQAGGWWLAGTILILLFVSAMELQAATRDSSTRIEWFVGQFAVFPVTAIWFYGQVFPGTKWSIPPTSDAIIAIMAIVPLLSCLLYYNAPSPISLLSVSLTVFASLYLSLFAFIPAVQSLPNGRALLWLTLFCVWTGDTLAYYGGRRFGKTKLTPLSPGKSREGALCGFLGSIVVGALIGHFTAIGTMHGLILGAFVGVFAPLGDLAESFWKRELGVKDLGTILPGHGGVLDRCDSLLFAAPTVYFVAKLLGV